MKLIIEAGLVWQGERTMHIVDTWRLYEMMIPNT